jgi:hypothetical protein
MERIRANFTFSKDALHRSRRFYKCSVIDADHRIAGRSPRAARLAAIVRRKPGARSSDEGRRFCANLMSMSRETALDGR